MDFIDNVHFLGSRNWRNLDFFPEVTNIFDAIIAGRIDFDNI